jgi:hypothetical protein
MAQHDYDIANQSFPSFRSDLNSVLEAINTSNSGTSRPSSAVAGTIWLDTTSASSPTLKFYDGSDDISLATLDYTANTVNWLDSTVSVNIVSDTTPQLGGDLDVNGNDIVSVANGNITITPDGTGKVIVDGLSYPTADGTNGQALITDGSGNLSFGDVAGGTNWQSSIVTGTTLSAVAGNGYWIDTTSNACTVTLPASASVGDTIEFSDYARTWATNNVTINTNSLNFQGNTSPNPVYDVSGQSVRIVYSGATQGWIPISDDNVTFETPQTISTEYLVIAGGASGASGNGGGGGAGGYLTNYGGTPIGLEPGETYTVTVGGGGSSTTYPPKSSGNSGSNSVLSGTGITTLTAIGGGFGGSGGSNTDGGDGGSGGGGGSTASGGSGTSPQGNDGGNSVPGSGGGGGGSASAGANGIAPGSFLAGNGGLATANSITGTPVSYAGGGGGGTNDTDSSGNGGDGGGGGATNGRGNPASSSSADANSGSGSGGTNDQGTGAGGSGIVILRVATADYSGTTTGSPTVSTDGTDTVIKFTGSGSYTA